MSNGSLILENVPKKVKFHKEELASLHQHLDDCKLSIKIYRRDVTYTMLTPKGEMSGDNLGVQGWLYYQSLTKRQMKLVSDTIQKFLNEKKIGDGFYLTFIEVPP